MTPVIPKVFFLGEPKIHLDGVEAWLRHIGGEEAVACLDHVDGADIEQLIELLARRCYKSFAPNLNPNVTKVRTDSRAYHANIHAQKHGSVVAHGHVHYAFEDVSRVFTHEIVRNSIGTERSQESLRYVRLTDIRFWIPPTIAEVTAESPVLLPDGVTAAMMTPEMVFNTVIEVMEWGQHTLARMYDIDHMKDFSAKKRITSAMRRIAPLGLATGIGISFNLRALRWIIEQRTDPAAEEEMRFVFGMVARDAMERWPHVFEDFEDEMVDGHVHYRARNSKI